jgi:DNA-binding NtrC family response regulator
MAESQVEVSEMTGHRVLLVDDDADFIDVLSERLDARGLRVTTAESGEAALEQAADKSFDAIILDLAMPGMNGIETLKRLRQINPDLQIILLTGHATVDVGVEAIKLGAVDLLEKPMDLKALMAKIDAASQRKVELTQKRLDEQLENIMRRKGW